MTTTVKELLGSVGICDDPTYYSGRGATRTDLNGDKLYKIYQKISAELGTKESEAFVTMVKNIKELSATVFIKSFYDLERNNWQYKPVAENNIDIGPDGPHRKAIGFATVFSKRGADETHLIRNSFLIRLT